MGRVFKRDGVEYMFKPDGGIQKQTYGDTTDFKKKRKMALIFEKKGF